MYSLRILSLGYLASEITFKKRLLFHLAVHVHSMCFDLAVAGVGIIVVFVDGNDDDDP